MKEELPPEAYDFVDFLNTPLPKDNIIVEILDSIGKVRAYIELTYESTNSASLKSFLTYLDVNLYRIETSIIGKLNIDSVKTPNGKVEIDNKISKALLSIIYYYLRDLERKIIIAMRDSSSNTYLPKNLLRNVNILSLSVKRVTGL
jgi:cob(I)alamin adenosyltransferase